MQSWVKLTCDAVQHQQDGRAVRKLLASLPAPEPVQPKGASIRRGHNRTLVVGLPCKVAQGHCSVLSVEDVR